MATIITTIITVAKVQGDLKVPMKGKCSGHIKGKCYLLKGISL
jgi:hypothetical protein